MAYIVMAYVVMAQPFGSVLFPISYSEEPAGAVQWPAPAAMGQARTGDAEEARVMDAALHTTSGLFVAY